MSKRTVKKVSGRNGAIRIVFDSDLKEYECRPVDPGMRNSAGHYVGVYYTDDLDDAVATARRMTEE